MADPNSASESMAQRWQRRAISIPLIVLLCLVVVANLPWMVPLAFIADLFRRRRFATLRCVTFFSAYLIGEVVFLALLLFQWLWSRGWSASGRERLRERTHAIANAWGLTLHTFSRVFFDVQVTVEGLDQLTRGGPVITLLRHASMADTVFSPVYLGLHAGFKLRYVVKRELQSDPVFDFIGNRLNACFVRRSSSDSAREIEAVCRLLDGMGRHDALVFYPEGTRFSAEKQAQVLERLADRLPPELLAKARQLRNVLPPRLGGPIALLEKNPGADLVLCKHVGYERAASFWQLWNGTAIGTHVQVAFTRIPYREVPREHDALVGWLFDTWLEADEWITNRLAAEVAVAPLVEAPEPPLQPDEF